MKFLTPALLFATTCLGIGKTHDPIGICHGSCTRTCSEFADPATCLLMGCEAVFSAHSEEMCSCQSFTKECGEFTTYFECEHLAGCQWVYDDNAQYPVSSDCTPEQNDVSFPTPSPMVGGAKSDSYGDRGFTLSSSTDDTPASDSHDESAGAAEL